MGLTLHWLCVDPPPTCPLYHLAHLPFGFLFPQTWISFIASIYHSAIAVTLSFIEQMSSSWKNVLTSNMKEHYQPFKSCLCLFLQLFLSLKNTSFPSGVRILRCLGVQVTYCPVSRKPGAQMPWRPGVQVPRRLDFQVFR